jgi:glycosyltransferase involved in cell wall biosynthesis
MRIGIDCLETKSNLAGGQLTYILGLLDGLYNLKEKDVKFVLFCSSENKHVFEPIVNKYKFSLIEVKGYNTRLRAFWVLIPLILNSKYLWRVFINSYSKIFKINKNIEDNCDLLYVFTTTLNSYNLSIPTVLSMHDIQHVHFPHFFSWLRRRVRTLRFENSALVATKIQASSNFIKEDLYKFFKFLKPNVISVIEEGVDLKDFTHSTKIEIQKKYNLPEKFLFFPAALWKHKNHLLVLKALKLIEETKKIKIPLILTGSKQSAYPDIIKFIKENDMEYVRYLGQISWEEIISLYQNAYLFITAVLYESSSLPIIEAAAAGLPIIASNTPPNIEMSKFLKMNLFDPYDVNELEKILFSCWNDNEFQKQSKSNKVNVKYYSWNRIAEKYMHVFKQL